MAPQQDIVCFSALCVGRSSRNHALIWSTAACTCVVYKTQSWKAGSSGGVGQLGPAGSQLLMWLAAWLTPLRCWRDGRSSGPRLPLRWAGCHHLPELPPFFVFRAQWARALAFQFFRLWAVLGKVGWACCLPV